MTHWYHYITIAVAVFFAGGWALGLVLSARNRTGSNILAVCVWWALLALAIAGTFNPLHLLWAFPAALIGSLLLVLAAGRL